MFLHKLYYQKYLQFNTKMLIFEIALIFTMFEIIDYLLIV